MIKDSITIQASPSYAEMYQAALEKIRHSTRMLDKAVGKLIVVDDEGKNADCSSAYGDF